MRTSVKGGEPAGSKASDIVEGSSASSASKAEGSASAWSSDAAVDGSSHPESVASIDPSACGALPSTADGPSKLPADPASTDSSASGDDPDSTSLVGSSFWRSSDSSRSDKGGGASDSTGPLGEP
jgi:hypothetical protein